MGEGDHPWGNPNRTLAGRRSASPKSVDVGFAKSCRLLQMSIVLISSGRGGACSSRVVKSQIARDGRIWNPPLQGNINLRFPRRAGACSRRFVKPKPHVADVQCTPLQENMKSPQKTTAPEGAAVIPFVFTGNRANRIHPMSRWLPKWFPNPSFSIRPRFSQR